ncbi:TolC family outer membrane protein [Magnetococcales bacterium HHB-1]
MGSWFESYIEKRRFLYRSKMYRLWIGVGVWSLISFLMPQTALATEPKAVSPKAAAPKEVHVFAEVSASALRENPQIAAYKAALAAAKQQYGVARSSLLPTVSVGLSKGHARYDWQVGKHESDPASMDISASQTLFSKSALETMKRVSPYVAAAEEDLSHIEQSVLYDALAASVGLLQAEEVARLAHNNHQVTQRHLEATQARFQVGEITRTDVSQAEARLASAEADRISAENDIAVNRARFQEVVGMKPPDNLAIPEGRSDWLEHPLKVLVQKLQDRPDVKAAKARLQVENIDIDIQKAGHYPTVALSASGSRSWNQKIAGRQDPVNYYSVGVEVAVPVYSGGSVVSYTAQARSERDQQQATVDQLLLQAVREVEQALLNYRSALAAVRSLETVVDASTEALSGVEQEFQVGTRTALDVLDAQNELFTAQTNLAKSRYNTVLAHYQLLKAVGVLKMEELAKLF